MQVTTTAAAKNVFLFEINVVTIIYRSVTFFSVTWTNKQEIFINDEKKVIFNSHYK